MIYIFIYVCVCVCEHTHEHACVCVSGWQLVIASYLFNNDSLS